MKKLLILLLLCSGMVIAQQGINYNRIISDDGAVIQNQIKIYPNPVKNTFTLDISKSTFLVSGNLKFQIFDLSGRLVKQVDKINALKRTIDVNDLNSGMYLYKLSGNGSDVASGKIIKK